MDNFENNFRPNDKIMLLLLFNKWKDLPLNILFY